MPKTAGKKPRRRPAPKRAKYYFDAKAAKAALDFIELFCTHTTGEWMGKPLKLRAWQRKIIREVFGWKRRADKTRRYRIVYISVGRKNGKSTFAAAVALYLLIADGEPGAQVYSAANDKPQAKLVWEDAAKMVEASPELSQVVQVYRSTATMIHAKSMSKYSAVSSESSNKDGLNVHGLVIDELHELSDRELYDKLLTARGGRRQPLVFIITTAGWDKNSLCWEIDQHARKVQAGEVHDDVFYAFVCGADEKDDWHDPAVWKKANPNFGISPKKSFLEDEHAEAIKRPSYENTFRRYYLNQWTEQAVRWLAMDRWDKAAGPVSWVKLPAHLLRRRGFLAFDLSATTDLTSLVGLFPDGDCYDLICKFYCPEEGLKKREERDKVTYRTWRSQGAITATPGEVVDYAYIRRDIEQWGREYEIVEIAGDKWNAMQLMTEMLNDGLPVVEVPQRFQQLSPATKELEGLVLSQRIRHGGHPILRWNMANVVVINDTHDNLMPSKKKSSERIDGTVATIIALSRALVADKGGSVYDKRGVLEI